jgi:acetyl-CoA acetyltransferase
MSHFERDCFISGIGQSDVGRRLGRSALDLTTQSCLAAIADAGLRPADIDGICTYPGGMRERRRDMVARPRPPFRTHCG